MDMDEGFRELLSMKYTPPGRSAECEVNIHISTIVIFSVHTIP